MTLETSLTHVGAFALLGLGLVFGLKHATEVDHVVAISTIVSEHRNVGRRAYRVTHYCGLGRAGVPRRYSTVSG